MPVRARFSPHPRGFGFLDPVGSDGVTKTTFTATDADGATRELDSIFCPPPVASGLIANDLVDVTYEVDEKGATATSATLVQRARRMAVGTVQQGPGTLVIEADHSIATGWITLDASLTPKLQMAMGRQVVVLIADGEDGAPIGRALVAGPHVKGSPQAVRARAVVAAMGGSAPSLFAGGTEQAGLDPVAAQTTHTRIVGMLAGGTRGGAAGLSTDGPIPGADLELHDRRAEPCITIDDASTQDVDDAIVAHWDGGDDEVVEAAVHIADVAAFVGVGSPADQYARVMASTAYLTVGHNAPMLDPALSEDALSLLPGVDRRAITVRFTVDRDGNIGDVDVESAVVSSDAKLSYAAVEKWLDGDTTDLVREAGEAGDEAEAILTATVEAARRLGVERDARATFEDLFQDAELEPAILDGKLRTKDAEPHARAYRLIERFMVAANEAVAGWLVKHDIPALYRAHVGLDPERADRLRAAVELVGANVPALTDPEAETDDVMGQLLAEIDRLGEEGNEADRDLLVAVATGSTARASYDVDPAHHRGLAASAYTHFTSPIRRYADLVVHRQIRSALAGEQPLHSAEDLGPLAAWLDFRSGAVSRAQAFERGDLWAVLLDRGFLDRPEPATVIGLSPAGLRVRIPRLGLNGFVTAERALGLPPKERGKLEIDDHGLETTSGPWRLGTQVKVKATGLDATGRPNLRLA